MYLNMSSNNRRTLRVLDATRTGHEADSLEQNLRRRVVGQDEAVDQVVKAYQTFLAGMACPGRPVGNFLFLGPTGSGKTRMVESTAEALLGDQRAMIKIDCADFAHSHEIAKLVGSPPGYLGHRETHPILSQESLDLYHTEKTKLSFVLFDEIEKASDTLWNLLLGILDKAILTLGDNRRVDFSRCMIFMTSNLGASEMANLTNPNLGFAAGIPRLPASHRESHLGKVTNAGLEAARRKFTPEYMNPIDKPGGFLHLGQGELGRGRLDLGRGLDGAGAGGEDVGDQFAAVEHLGLGGLLQIAHLARRQVVVEDDHVGVCGFDLLLQFVQFASANIGGRIDREAFLGNTADDSGAGRGGQTAQLFEGIVTQPRAFGQRDTHEISALKMDS